MYVRSDKLQKHKPNEVFVFLRGGATERVSAALLLGASLAQSATTASGAMGGIKGERPLDALFFELPFFLALKRNGNNISRAVAARKSIVLGTKKEMGVISRAVSAEKIACVTGKSALATPLPV